SYATITYEGKEHSVPAAGQVLTINGREASPGTIVEDGAVIAYQKGRGTANVSEALLAVGFTPPPATSRVTFAILVNGVRADFTSPIHTGDTLEVVLTPIDAPPASTAPALAEKSADPAAPAASTILSGIAARAAQSADGSTLFDASTETTESSAVPSANTGDQSAPPVPQDTPAPPAQETPPAGTAITVESLMRYD
ncbi:MAG: cell division protein, partial [Selenomonas sp.]|nr:cell division protein [Selenomonas sp.]